LSGVTVIYYSIKSWRGAAAFATWVFLLSWGALILFLLLEPDVSAGRAWSAALGALLGWLAGLDLVSSVKRVYGLPPSSRTRLAAVAMALPGAAIHSWFNPVDVDAGGVVTAGFPVALLPFLVMGLSLVMAGWWLAEL
jgi:hypothetical protein